MTPNMPIFNNSVLSSEIGITKLVISNNCRIKSREFLIVDVRERNDE